MNNHGNRHVGKRSHDGSKQPALTKAEKKQARLRSDAGRKAARPVKKVRRFGKSVCIYNPSKGLPERPRCGLAWSARNHGSTYQH